MVAPANRPTSMIEKISGGPNLNQKRRGQDHDNDPDRGREKRAQHRNAQSRPRLSLDAGPWIVCDRFFDSTLAYQGYGDGADRGFIASLIGQLGIVPDLTIVLNVPEAVATERMRRRGGDTDRYERLDAAFSHAGAAGIPGNRGGGPEALRVAGRLGGHTDCPHRHHDSCADTVTGPDHFHAEHGPRMDQ
jgi:hypothetical protein